MLNEKEVRDLLKAKVVEMGGYARAAEQMYISRSYLVKVTLGKEPMSPSALRYLGLRRRYIYEPEVTMVEEAVEKVMDYVRDEVFDHTSGLSTEEVLKVIQVLLHELNFMAEAVRADLESQEE